MTIAELLVMYGCVLGIIIMIVITIYQYHHCKHSIVDMSSSIRIMQSIIDKMRSGYAKCSTNDYVSINLSSDEFREVLEEIEAVALDIQVHEYPSDIRIEKLAKIHEQTTYLSCMENTKEMQSILDKKDKEIRHRNHTKQFKEVK